MTLIADTGGVRKVVAEEPGPIVVPAALLSEIDYLLREFLGVDAELAFLDNLISGAFLLGHPSLEDIHRIRDLVAQYRDLGLGLADASVVATAERLEEQRILTVDERDFRVVMPRSGKPLTLLPADA